MDPEIVVPLGTFLFLLLIAFSWSGSTLQGNSFYWAVYRMLMGWMRSPMSPEPSGDDDKRVNRHPTHLSLDCSPIVSKESAS